MFTITAEIFVFFILALIALKLFADVAYHTDAAESTNTEDRVLATNLENEGLDVEQEVLRFTPEPSVEEKTNISRTVDSVLVNKYPVLTDIVAKTTEVDRQAARVPDTTLASYYQEDALNGKETTAAAKTEIQSPAVAEVSPQAQQAIKVAQIQEMESPPSSMFGQMDFSMDNARDIVAMDRY